MQSLIKSFMLIALSTLLASVGFANILVEKGTTVNFTTEALNNKKAVVTVEWSQMMSKKSADYVQVTAVVQSKTPTLTMLFIAKPFVDAIKSANCKGEKCSLKVDDRFQYGQNKEKTMRFLVLHDKSNKPFQHRFVNTSTLATFASGAEMMAKQAGKLGGFVPQIGMAAKAGQQAISAAKSIIGDPLRDF